MSWAGIVGHDDKIAAFRRVRARGRMAHAYLFVGPPGVGKRTFAVALAKALLCENPPAELDACGACPACSLVDARTHPDFFLVGKPEDVNELPIDVVRELCSGFMLTSARGHGKVAILDDADLLNDAAANCFLKTLEEPPPGSVFVLVGTSLDIQLPTIRSRCHAIRFAPLAAEEVRSLLEARELPDPAMIPRLVRTCAGSPGTAVALADPEIWRFRDRLIAGLSQPRIDAMGLGKAFAEFAEDAGKEAVLHRARAELAFHLILAALRDAAYVRAGGDVGEDAQLLQPLAQRVDADKTARLVARVLEAETQVDRYVPVSLVVEALVDALAQLLEK